MLTDGQLVVYSMGKVDKVSDRSITMYTEVLTWTILESVSTFLGLKDIVC